MTVVEFQPKNARKRKLDPARALEQVLATKPRTILIVATNGDADDLTVFTGGERSSEVNWLLDIAKAALLTGEFERE